MADETDGYYASLPVFDRFEAAGDTSLYRPLPPGWIIGISDIESSASAIAEGRYKEVNMVGASVIAAVMNAAGTRRFPFVFGGDGAVVALPGAMRGLLADALARSRRYAEEGLGLALRVGLLPIEQIRAAGRDVTVALHAPSPHVAYALIAGGGVAWAGAELKAGRLALPEAPAGAWPDLDGLSCRWRPIPARNGHVVSLVAVPAPGAPEEDFGVLARRVVALVERLGSTGNPAHADGLDYPAIPKGLALEAKRADGWLGSTFRWLKLVPVSIVGALLFRYKLPLGRFRPRHYIDTTIANADYRKIEDGLLMTIDATPEIEAGLRELLEAAREAGLIRYGLHVQDTALMTCLVPSVLADDHFHFIDGGAGGYARAAAMLKAQQVPPAAAA